MFLSTHGVCLMFGTIRISIFFLNFFENLVFCLSFQVYYKFIQSILSNTGNCTQYFVITYRGRKRIYIYMYVYFYVYVYACSAASVVSDSLRPRGPCPARLLCPWGSPAKNTGVGCQALLQGIFLTQG